MEGYDDKISTAAQATKEKLATSSYAQHKDYADEFGSQLQELGVTFERDKALATSERHPCKVDFTITENDTDVHYVDLKVKRYLEQTDRDKAQKCKDLTGVDVSVINFGTEGEPNITKF